MMEHAELVNKSMAGNLDGPGRAGLDAGGWNTPTRLGGRVKAKGNWVMIMIPPSLAGEEA